MALSISLGTRLPATCGSFLSAGAICGDGGDGYPLPPGIAVVEDTQAGRWQETPRLLSHGSSVNGLMVDARDFEIDGLASSATDVAQRQLLQAIAQAAFKENCFLQFDPSFYINVKRVKKFQRTHQAITGRTLTDNKLQFRATDPFWYATSWQQQIQAMTGTGTFTVTVDSLVAPDVNPIIQITAPSSAAVPSLTLANQTDPAGRFFTYADPQLNNGATANLDCRFATATNGATNTIRYFDGYWLKLFAGTNTLSYTGPACTITLSWQPRYL